MKNTKVKNVNNMESKVISVKKAVSLIREKKLRKYQKVDFKNQKINSFDALLLGKNGVDVPEELIDYDDHKIDFSDIPEITDEDLATGKINWDATSEIQLNQEVSDWIKRENININEFAAMLIQNFYENMKSFHSSKV